MRRDRILRLAGPGPWLLPLAALLLFGNCGGGVRGMLSGLGDERRTQLRNIIATERAQRAAARTQLRGRARRQEIERVERRTNAQLDSLLRHGRGPRKLQHRRGKLERQLLRDPFAGPRPWPIGPNNLS